MLKVGEDHHRVALSPPDVDTLLDSLVSGGSPASEPARAALEALVAADLVDPVPAHRLVIGDGVLAQALRDALLRMGGRAGAGATPVSAFDVDTDLPPAGDVCWITQGLVILAPPDVAAADVAARRRAATTHREADPAVRPDPRGRHVSSTTVIPAAGLELAAVTVAAELLRPQRPPLEAVTIDLHALTVARRPVLPVPPPPR